MPGAFKPPAPQAPVRYTCVQDPSEASLGSLLLPHLKWKITNDITCPSTRKNLLDFPWPDGNNEREGMKLILSTRPLLNAHVERWSKRVMEALRWGFPCMALQYNCNPIRLSPADAGCSFVVTVPPLLLASSASGALRPSLARGHWPRHVLQDDILCASGRPLRSTTVNSTASPAAGSKSPTTELM